MGEKRHLEEPFLSGSRGIGFPWRRQVLVMHQAVEACALGYGSRIRLIKCQFEKLYLLSCCPSFTFTFISLSLFHMKDQFEKKLLTCLPSLCRTIKGPPLSPLQESCTSKILPNSYHSSFLENYKTFPPAL